MRIKVKVPGKIMLAGEYSVLEPGGGSIVSAISRHMSAEIGENDRVALEFPDLNVQKIEILPSKSILSPVLNIPFGKGLDPAKGWILEWDRCVSPEVLERIKFARTAITMALWLAAERGGDIRGFSLGIKSGLGGASTKPGFGGSAATTVSCCSLILSFCGIDCKSKNGMEDVLKLSLLSHYIAQGGKGSGADVASVFHGGAGFYTPPLLPEIYSSIKEAQSLGEILGREWEGMAFRKLEFPHGLSFALGWTGKGSSTEMMIGKMEGLEGDERRSFKKMVSEIRDGTTELYWAIGEGQISDILNLIDKLGRVVERFDANSGAGMMSNGISKAIEIARNVGCAAKMLGAGGGDSVIAVSDDERKIARTEEAWRSEGISPVDAQIEAEGMVLETGA